MDSLNQQIPEEFLEFLNLFVENTNISETVGRDKDGYQVNMIHWASEKGYVQVVRGVASSESQGGPKAQFCPTFRKIHFLLRFYVTMFWDFKSQGGPRPPWTPQLRRPCRW